MDYIPRQKQGKSLYFKRTVQQECEAEGNVKTIPTVNQNEESPLDTVAAAEQFSIKKGFLGLRR